MIELGYWKIRGLGAPLRMMVEYAGVEYSDSQYESGSSWFKEGKPRILAMNPLANLPYVVDGDTCVVQSNACMVYLGEKFGFYQGIRDLELLTEIYDLRNALMDLVYPHKKATREGEFSAALDAHKKTVLRSYEKLEACVKGPFMLGTIACCDFHIFEMIDQHEKMAREYGHSYLAGFPKLTLLHRAFLDEPKLAKYFASDAYSLPCNNPRAKAYFT